MHRLAVAMLVVALAPELFAADDATPALPLGTIDVLHIYKNYQPFQQQLAPLREALQELEQTIGLRQTELDQLQRKLPTASGEERARIQMQLAKLQTELRVHVEGERQKITKSEIKIQAGVYKLVQIEVQKIAKARGLKLVLVRPRTSLDSQDIGEVTRTLNQLVIFEDGLDITDDVLAALAELPAKSEENEE